MQRKLIFLFLTLLASSFLKAQPKASFTASPNKGCSPATIKFINQSTGTGLTYFWDLGNGNTSTVKDPKAIYYSVGLYAVKLIVTDNSGKKDSITKIKFIEVFKNPIAYFDAQTLIGCTPFDPELKDKSTRGSGMISEWTWDYGDGKVVTGQTPVYAYTTEGIYTVSLVTKDVNGCQSDTLKKQYITVKASPQVIFSADKTTSCSQPFTVNFTNKSTGLKTGDQFEWDFGDGTKSTDKNPKKTFTDSGSFSITLNIKPANGCNAGSKISNYITISKPKPSFTYQPGEVCANRYVIFNNTSTPKSSNLLCNWDFGDGNTAKGEEVMNSYKTKGSYTVKLTVSLPDGSCKETLTVPNSIKVLTQPNTKFTISDTLFCQPGYMDTFIDKTTGVVARYWYLNRNFISSKPGLILKIKEPGYSEIMLMTFNGSCYDSVIKLIYKDSIKPIFILNPQKGCAPLMVTFKDITQSKIPITSRVWDLGDGNFQNQDSFEYTYTKAGMYIVKLTVTTESECTFTSQDTIWVETKPDLTFNFPYTEACNTYDLTIANAKNKNGQKIDIWKWFLYTDFTDSINFDTNQIFKLRLRAPATNFNIKLVAGKNECYDTFTKRNILRILPPYVRYGIAFTCTGYPYTLVNTSDSADEIRWIFKDSVVINKQTLIIKNGDPWPLRLWGKNFKYGCEDSTSIIQLDTIKRRIGFNFTGSLCAPASLRFHNWYFPDYEKYIWDWGDGKRETGFEYGDKVFAKPGTYKVTLIGITNECRDSISHIVNVTDPKLSIDISPKEGCGPLTITLINKTSDTSDKNKFWLISGLAPIPVTADTMYYTLKQPGPLAGGKYSISFSVQDENKCKATATDTVKVLGMKFYFNFLSMATCAYPKLTIQPLFPDPKIDTKNMNYFWEVGDGRKFTGSIIDYYYKTAGTYKVSLKISDGNGCVTERDTLIVNNFKSISANLIADLLDANCPPLRVNFISKSEAKFGKIVKYLWDFSDGSSSNLLNPSHVYLKAGKFTVTLAVTDDLGCSDKIVFKDLILIEGPVGTYTFDKKAGCTPLFVNFNTIVSNTHKLEWDMGDGLIIEDSLQAGHLYTRIGKYIPLLVLADSFGCKYTLPPIDTIKVFPYPVPQFSFTTACPKLPVYFKNMSTPLKGTIAKCEWNFGDGDTSMRLEPNHIFKTKGTYNVTLKVWNTDGCEAEIMKQVVVKNSTAGFKPGKDFYCTGQIPTLINTSKSDTTFETYHWFLNDSFISKNANPVLPRLSSGLYKITLATIDNFGCTDTFIKNQGLIISDTLAPTPPFIYRVSVENDNSVVLDFSGYRNFDFKQYTIYSAGKKIVSVSDKNDTSKIINSLNTLRNVYCYKVTTTNLCDYESYLNLAFEHCTVEAKATGDLKKVNVTWNAYKGWPVNRYEIFREELGSKGKYNYLATVSGNQLNYTDTNVFCKMVHFYKIKAFENVGYNQISWSDTTAAKPLFANSVPPNNTIRATVDLDKEIIIEWTGSGSPRIPVMEYVLEKSEDGVHYKWYQSFQPDQFAYTDTKVLVDNKSYFYRTYAIDTCEILSPFTNFAKTILLKADTTIEERPFVKWSTYQGWNEGVNEYEVQRKKPDGTFVTIGFTSAYDSMLVDNVTDLNGYPFYCYRVIGYKNISATQKQIISISNEDCAPVRSRIFAANAFTINGDNINETFDIKGLYIKDYSIKIFTRWGEKIFESNDMNVDWDGYYNGRLCQMDAYIWIIKAVGVDDLNWPMTGTVTLIR